ncbi:hypothetical protein OH77DRAFT_1429605 [Trametes cingulata]|nr:hypothetical protein OH77DRAFT_1429605 [Trametes cingulata]
MLHGLAKSARARKSCHLVTRPARRWRVALVCRIPGFSAPQSRLTLLSLIYARKLSIPLSSKAQPFGADRSTSRDSCVFESAAWRTSSLKPAIA